MTKKIGGPGAYYLLNKCKQLRDQIQKDPIGIRSLLLKGDNDVMLKASDSNKVRVVLSPRDYERMELKKEVYKDVSENLNALLREEDKLTNQALGRMSECVVMWSSFELAWELRKQMSKVVTEKEVGGFDWRRKIEVEPADVEMLGKLSKSILEAAQSIKDGGEVKDSESDDSE